MQQPPNDQNPYQPSYEPEQQRAFTPPPPPYEPTTQQYPQPGQQQPSYPYPPQQPHMPYGQPPQPPKRKYPLWVWIVCAIIAIGLLTSAIQSLTKDNNTTTQTNADQQATPQPTQAEPTPTPVPPTPTPKPLTPQQTLTNMAQDQVLSHKATVAINGTIVTVTADASDNLTEKMVAEGCQMDIYAVQKAFWTSDKLPKNTTEVRVVMNGQLQDKYGKTSTGAWASGTLNKDDAGKMVWDNLTWKSAWDVYTDKYMIGNLQDALNS